MIRRPNSVRISREAFRHNLAVVRSILPAQTEIWQVCKGEGYGLGVLNAAELGIGAGLTSFCVGTPEEAFLLREAFPAATVLLFPGARASDLPEICASGILVTAHSMESLLTVLDMAPRAGFLLKVNTGLNRYGFDLPAWPKALGTYSHSEHRGLQGIYTHISQSEADLDKRLALFDRFLAAARNQLRENVPSMAAASPALLARPDIVHDRVDPGRALYGMFRPSETRGHRLRPVVTEITSELVECRKLDSLNGANLGYEDGGSGSKPTRIGTFPIGHFDGLPSGQPLGSVLIKGKEVPVLARTLLSSIVDLSAVPDAAVGEKVVLAGQSGPICRTIWELAESLRMSVLALHVALIRSLPKAVE